MWLFEANSSSNDMTGFSADTCALPAPPRPEWKRDEVVDTGVGLVATPVEGVVVGARK